MSAPSSPARRPTATRVVAVASAVAVAGVAVVRNRQARRETAADAAAALVGPLGATGRSHRSLVTARAATRAGQVAETLGNMKGAMMKLGQMASYLDQGLPEPVRDALAQLQSDAPPMAYELAAG
jgi:predicted unusual protein kinase regulating ubiquinone biosynthesis (AarF/ABC1/UbiB family)